MADGTIKYDLVGDAGSLVAAGQQGAQAFNQTGAAAAKATDDTARYEQALRRMAEAQKEASEAAASARPQTFQMNAAVAEAARYQQALEKMAVAQEEAGRQKSTILNPFDDARSAAATRLAEANSKAAAQEAFLNDTIVEGHDKAGKAIEKTTGHSANLHKIFHALNEVVPGLGTAMQSAFSPQGAAIAGVVMGIKLLYDYLQEVEAEYKAVTEEAAKPLTRQLDAQREAAMEAGTAHAAFTDRLEEARRAQDGMREATERAVSALRDQAQLDNQVRDSAKDAELRDLEKLNNDKLISEEEYQQRKAEIEQRYREQARQAQEDQLAAEMEARDQATIEAAAKQPTLEAEADSALEEKIKAKKRLDALPQQSVLDENKKKANADLEEFVTANSHLINSFEKVKNGGPADAGFSQELFDKYEKLKAASSLADEAVTKLPGEQIKRQKELEQATRKEQRASQKAEANEQFITDSRQKREDDMGRLRRLQEANQRIAGNEAPAPAGFVPTGSIGRVGANGDFIPNTPPPAVAELGAAADKHSADMDAAVSKVQDAFSSLPEIFGGLGDQIVALKAGMEARLKQVESQIQRNANP